jgi:uncharacterized membrane protein
LADERTASPATLWGKRVVNQNLGKGVLLAAVALFFLVQGPELTLGSFIRPGPGLFPVMVASILLFIAIVVIVRSRFTDSEPLDFRIRNIALIAAALVSFTLISEYVDMLAGIAVLATLASLASEDFSIPRTATIAAALCLVAIAMNKGLGVHLPLY